MTQTGQMRGVPARRQHGRAGDRDVPEPGPGQVLLAMKASSICGSDIRAIYREHLGHGPEAYQGVVAGHEPCGQVVAVARPAVVWLRATASWSTTSRGVASASSAAAAT